MKRFFLLCSLFGLAFAAKAQLTAFEKDPEKNSTATYAEAIAFYQQLDQQFEQLKLITCGPTDSGKPLHLAVLSKSKVFDPLVLRKQNKRIILINNAYAFY